ncbi:sigma-70 family RNA polymerase sigma factor [Bacillus sp. NP157]|nr:sigma-70 family RNA polymerase sigma factor [Bacillus sp. NP157]
MSTNRALVDDLALRHLDAAYNLGRWLLGSEQDAADAVHDAYLRAARACDTYAGGNARAWWLAIVRNCCLARLAVRSKERKNVAIDDNPIAAERWLPRADGQAIEDDLDSARQRSLLARHLRNLPDRFREVLILREIEELSYREIADVLETPIGTVMSRLARGRALLQKALSEDGATEVRDGL